jgi:predicted O-linked N-acetylglucosamine transferase (SPINDLY family)
MSTAPTATVLQTFALALQHHRSGQLAEAETLYRRILAEQPGHPEALHHLGIVAHQLQRHPLAVELISRALALLPNNPVALCNLAAALVCMDRYQEAAETLRKSLQLNPDQPEAENSLGVVLRKQRRTADALAAFYRALLLKPDYAEAYSNLGIALAESGQLDDAVDAFRQAISLKPDHAPAYNNLGIALSRQRLLDEAIAHYRLAIRLAPRFHEAHVNLGTALGRQGLLDQAVASYRQAIALQPQEPTTHNNLGNTLKDQGQLDEALAAFREAIRLQPAYHEAHSNLIYALHFHSDGHEDAIARETRGWNERYARPLQPSLATHPHARDPGRPLRIGYVSPDFREHTIGLYLRPLFLCHDPRQFELLCYSGVIKPDELTAQFRQRSAVWRDTQGISDDALADIIRQDRVDILVDLTLHMAGNRLPVFARQPAPVQLSFAGYTGSTGLEAIRYRISDRFVESQIATGPTHERVLLVEHFWCYDPVGVALAVNSMPAREKGYLTFGCLNNFCKLNAPLLRLWAEILQQAPHSRLLLLTGEGSHRQRTLETFQLAGIEPERIQFARPRPRPAYLALYHSVDIALDPFPYQGQATSLDALWMGVPVVTLVGERAVSRAGFSQLSALNLQHLAAFSEDEYVRIAAELASDWTRLAEFRLALRRLMETSPLMDAPRFTRDVETAYRSAWRQWCSAQAPSSR